MTRTASYPVTIHADNGAVTLSAQPTHIISLSPTMTEMLYAVGAGDDVVAADTYSDYPADVPNADIDSYHLNVEALTKYSPDLVIASGLTDDQLTKLNQLSIPALVFPAATKLDDTYSQLAELGKATGHAKDAAELVSSMKQKIADIVASAPDFDQAPTYYYELGTHYYSATSDTFIGQVLGLLGLHSIADDAKGAAKSGGYPQLNAEFILKANPDYIFLSDTVGAKQSAKTVAARPGWASLDAVKDHRVVGLNDDIASRWGPRITTLLSTVATALKDHPVS